MDSLLTLLSLKGQIENIIDFVQGKSKSFTFVDWEGSVKTFFSLDNFPDEITLLKSNRNILHIDDLGNVITWKFSDEVQRIIIEANNTWTFFTGNHEYPVPKAFIVNKDIYDPYLIHQYRLEDGSFWTFADFYQTRLTYLNYLHEVVNNLIICNSDLILEE